MTPLTDTELRQFAPSARRDYIDALVGQWNELDRAKINTPARVCEFLGQHAHETGGFTIVRENTSWTAEQMCRLWPSRFKTRLDPRIVACGRDPVKLASLAYSGRADLGNQGGDDGYVYRGGSFCQLTGRAAYREAGAALGLPLEEKPELIERAEVGLRVAIWYWTKRGCSTFADRGYTRAIGNAINRGNPYSKHEPIGAADRKQWRDRAIAIFGDGEAIHADGLALGAYGSEVEVLQRRLRDLRYGLGASDSVFGPATARAVAAFKLDWQRDHGAEIEPAEIVGPRTWAALNVAAPVVYAERETATAADLAAAGSTEVQAGSAMKTVGYATTAVGAAGAAQQAGDVGLLEPVKTTIGWVPEMHGAVMPVVSAAQWAASHAWWVLAIVAGVVIWSVGGKTIAARLKAHVEGWNLFR
jgi:putative chitinase